MKAANHPFERQRLSALRRYNILDSPVEQDFEDIVQLTAQICEVPISIINLIDENRQWFKAEVGLGVRETPLETSICAHVILQDDFVEIQDTRTERRLLDNPLCFNGRSFCSHVILQDDFVEIQDTRTERWLLDNPLCIKEGGFRFYAGALLKTEDNLPLGTLCVLDYKPRQLTPSQRELIRVLAKQVMNQFELRRTLAFQHVLRKEVHHRVSNSLSSVVSLIRLQKQESEDPLIHDTLNAIESRINTIARLHRELCHADTAENMDLQPFMERLGQYLASMADANVSVTIKFDSVIVDAQQASAIAIIVNEFVTNSLKHAFPNDRKGAIQVVGTVTSDQTLSIRCRDNGVGPSRDVADRAKHGGLGMMIIDVTASQLNAERHVEPTKEGFTMDFIIRLKDDLNSTSK